MAFKFRLQSVLDHRRHLEELAMNTFAETMRALTQAEEQIRWLEEEHSRARDELQNNNTNGIPAKDYILANEYATVLRLQSLREQSRLPMLKSESERARQKLLEATRDRKVLETLREKHLTRYNREQLIFEQKLLDEAAISGHARRDIQ
jgi:flagellar FliJ protein